MHKNGKTIAIAVDPRSLPLGTNCSGFVYGYDENCPEKGAVFEVPVTVIRPIIMADHTISHALQVIDCCFRFNLTESFTLDL